MIGRESNRSHIERFIDDYGHLLSDNVISVGFGPGWEDLVRSLADRMEQIIGDHEVYITQIKEKFGGLRFYVGMVPSGIADDLYTEIRRYSARSYTICEECGEPGVLRQGSWIRTLCDEHAKGREPTMTHQPDNLLEYAMQGHDLSYRQLGEIRECLRLYRERHQKEADRAYEFRCGIEELLGKRSYTLSDDELIEALRERLS